jgi:hypothetical protein
MRGRIRPASPHDLFAQILVVHDDRDRRTVLGTEMGFGVAQGAGLADA